MKLKLNVSKSEIKKLSKFNGEKALIVLNVSGVLKNLCVVGTIENFIAGKETEVLWNDKISDFLSSRSFKYLNFLSEYKKEKNQFVFELLLNDILTEEEREYVLNIFETKEERKNKKRKAEMLLGVMSAFSCMATK